MKPYWKPTVCYIIFGIIWIFTSDRAIESLSNDNTILTFLQTIKGWLFVMVSSLLIFGLTRRAFRQQANQEQARLELFEKTIEGAHHILLNYLNQMQLVSLEAEASKDFDKRILALSRESSARAAEELGKLARIEEITSEQIDSVVYRDLKVGGASGSRQ